MVRVTRGSGAKLGLELTERDVRTQADLERVFRSIKKGQVDGVQGALLSYGVNFRAQGEQAARYADRLLKGGRPGDLPVEQPTKFELAVNMKTEKALGLAIPPSLLLRADLVIE